MNLSLQPSCEDRGIEIRKASIAREIELVKAEYLKFSAAADNVEKFALVMANVGRKIGLHLQAMCGHDQMSFDFWQKNCDKQLPFDFNCSRGFISIARAMENPAVSLKEVAKHIQPLLAVNGNLMLSERTETQTPAAVSLMQVWWNEIAKLRQPYKKLVSEKDMDSWSDNALGTTVSELEWAVEVREKAKTILERRMKAS